MCLLRSLKEIFILFFFFQKFYTEYRHLSRSLVSSSHLSITKFKLFRSRLQTSLKRIVGRPSLADDKVHITSQHFLALNLSKIKSYNCIQGKTAIINIIID